MQLDWYPIVTIPPCFLVATLLSALILRYFTNKKRLSWHIYLVVGYSYCISFLALGLITIDLSDGLYHKTSHEPPLYLYIIWQLVYWSIQILAWLLIPIAQSYIDQGHFKWYRRLLAAVVANIIIYIVLGVVCILALAAFIIWLALKSSGASSASLSPDSIIGLCISLSNAFGMILLIVLLGNGIAKLPKYLWHRANHRRTLLLYQFRASKVFEDVERSQAKYVKLLTHVRSMDVRVSETHPNRKYLNHMVKKVDADLSKFNVGMSDTSRSSTKSRLKQIFSAVTRRTSTDVISDKEMVYKNLVRLNRKLTTLRRKFKKTAYHWEWIQQKAFYLEAIIAAHGSPERKIVDPFQGSRSGPLAGVLDFTEWLWHVRIQPIAYRLFAILLLVFAVILIWCEFSIVFQKSLNFDMSVFSLLIRTTRSLRILFQLLSLTIITCMTIIVFFALFNLKLFSYLSLIPHHSDAASLLFTAVFLCRVVPALCYNFLQLAGISSKDGVAFYKVMGIQRFDGLAFFGSIGDYFQYYFPVIIILVALLTFFDVTGRIGTLFGLDRFVGSETMDSERVQEGRDILTQERQYRMKKLVQEAQQDAANPSGLDSEDDEASDILRPSRGFGLEDDESEPIAPRTSTVKKIKSLFTKNKREIPRESLQLRLGRNYF